ncbi:tail spike protein [Klebsiella phage K5]|uniref:Probable tail spike protein n=1 Tax=Klebsiella phage K5 TaxID=1647374 RepID=A0A0F7LA61_9CAUD|nr:tail protein [Klebsiella phage K5]AKH49582.1 tail spike protein [Klebsiella phage K5]
MDQDIKTVIQYPVGATEFDIPFDYLSRKFVRVSLVSDDNRRLLSNITEYRYVSKTRVKLLVETTGFDRVEIRRFTSASERVVDFSDGSVLRAVDLNVSQLQSAHIAEEARDAALLAMPEDDAGNLDARNRKIVRLAPGEIGSDAVNKDQLDTTLGEAGGMLADMKELDKVIRDFVENFANDPASLRGVVWVYNGGAAIGGETTIIIDKPGDVLAVPCLYINGSRQDVGIAYDYDNKTKTITFKGDSLQTGDLLVAMTAEGSVPLADVLMSLAGARYVMTSRGISVEAAIAGMRGDVVTLVDMHSEADGNDYAPAATKALATGRALFVPAGEWTFNSTVSIPSGARIFGTGAGSILRSPEATDAAGTAIQTVLMGQNVSNVELKDFKVNGGSGAVHTVKRNRRGVRFIECQDVRVKGLEVSRTADWALSFERCKGVVVDNYRHRRSESALSGGRDGLHFLDCDGFSATNLDIESHDDCVGITSEKSGTFDGIVNTLRGTSMIGSLVIYNEEQASGQYIPTPMRGLIVTNIRAKRGQTARQLVRIAAYATGSTASDVTVSNVQGDVTASHGVQIQSVSNVNLRDINVSVINSSSHGVYLQRCVGVVGNVRGKTVAATHDGIQMTGCTNVVLEAESAGSAGNGVQVNGCTNVVLSAVIDSAGTNGVRVVNSTNVDIPSGIFSGTFGIFGINQAGNTGFTPSDSIVWNTTSPRINTVAMSMVMRTPTVVIEAKEDSTGELIIYRAIGATITRVATGRYTISYASPMSSTQHYFSAEAFHPGNIRNVYTISAVSTNGITLGVRNAEGVDTYSEYIRFVAYNY